MSYQVLARKWRPRTFQDMVGQAPTLRMLKNAIEQKRIHHAYLFTGTRGVGKTTLARIIAKCLNCETNITATPCGQCHACLSIDAGKFLDLYEIDAASRTKVEDTRELLDNVLYPPNQGRYKVYLIDEVHMLSHHSFNALLKTLEEPPDHVKFLLATTDPKRIPITILSRCLQFHLTRITPEQIQQQLQHICEAEKITYETAALAELAKAADGSMRDALSLLDQAIVYGQNNISQQEVGTMLGCIAQDELLPLLEALAARDGNALFQAIVKLNDHAADFHQVLDALTTAFHQIAIAQIVPTIYLAETLSVVSKRFTPEDIQLYYQITLLGKRDLSMTPNPRLGFEMIMLRMLAFQLNTPLTQAHQTTTCAKDKNKKAADPLLNATPINNIISTAMIQENTVAHSSRMVEWRDILPKLELSGMAYALATNCTIEKMSDNHLTLALSTYHQPMLNEKLKERISEALTRYFKHPIQLDIHLTAAEIITPLKQKQHDDKQELINARCTVMQDPQVQKLIEMYDATVDINLTSF